MINTIYLQKEKKDFILSVKYFEKNDLSKINYFILEQVPRRTTIKDLKEMIKEKYKCKKLVIQF